jgi:hypothetical protein
MLGGGQLIETSKIYSRENERKHRKAPPPKKNGVVSLLEEEVKEEGKKACNDLSLSLSDSPRQGEIDKETALPRARLFTVESQKLGRTQQIENILPR